MWQILLCGAVIVSLAMGIRHGFGLWLQPMTQELGWGREDFATAIGIQNICWGLFGIFSGMLADRFGAFRVMVVSALLYALGLWGMSHAVSPAYLSLTAGVMVGAAQAGTFKTALPAYAMAGEFTLFGFPVVAKGASVHDVYSMVFLGFTHPVVSLFYIVAVGLLSLHLLHGVESMFQTLGWRNHRWGCGLRRASAVLCALYFLGNAAIPGAILSGAAKPAAGTAAAKRVVAASHQLPAHR